MQIVKEFTIIVSLSRDQYLGLDTIYENELKQIDEHIDAVDRVTEPHITGIINELKKIGYRVQVER